MKWRKDALERTLWTAIQAALATVVISELGLPEWAIAPAAALLAAVKAVVARKVGDAETASLP